MTTKRKECQNDRIFKRQICNADKMVIGYITKKNMMLSLMGELYIDEIKNYLSQYDKNEENRTTQD